MAFAAVWFVVAEVTSKEVGRKASRLLKRRTLTDADLADVKAVAASALTQRAEAINQRRVTAAYQSLGLAMERACLSEKLMAKLEKLGALLFPAKP